MPLFKVKLDQIKLKFPSEEGSILNNLPKSLVSLNSYMNFYL